MNNLDKQYQSLLQDILDNGVHKEDRTGTGTLSVFGRQVRHKMSEGFPLLTTKKMYFKGIVTELLWFLRGDTSIEYLLENDCNIWTGDAYKVYLKKYEKDKLHGVIYEDNETHNRPFYEDEFINWVKNNDKFSELYGDLGPIYGKQWRSWGRNATRDEKIVDPGVYTKQIDQITNLIHDLKINPDSRRLMVSAWNVGELDQMTLPPCHYGFQVYTRELTEYERGEILQPSGLDSLNKEGRDRFWKENNLPTRAISLMWNQRSVDTFLGLPFNIASYGLLLEIIAKEVNMVPDELIGNLGDTHLYLNHVDQAKEQIGRELTIEERIDLASKKYNTFDIMDFGIPFTCTHEDIDKMYPVERQTREPYPLPKLKLDDWYSTQGDVNNSTEVIMDCLMGLNHGHITLENYQSHPTIKAPLSN